MLITITARKKFYFNTHITVKLVKFWPCDIYKNHLSTIYFLPNKPLKVGCKKLYLSRRVLSSSTVGTTYHHINLNIGLKMASPTWTKKTSFKSLFLLLTLTKVKMHKCNLSPYIHYAHFLWMETNWFRFLST